MILKSQFGTNFVQSYDAPHGVGPHNKLFVDCTPYIDKSKFQELHNEIVIGLATMDQNHMRWAKFGGTMPDGWYENSFLEEELLVDYYDQLTDFDKETISKLNTQQIRKFLYFSKSCLKPWAFTVYLRNGSFSQKTKNNLSWEPVTEAFPKLKKYIETLPFEQIGRVMLFCTDAFRDVPVHRDYIPVTHYDHNINFFFDKGRPAFIFDPINKLKHFIDPNCQAYFFNNRDFHGVEAEDRFRYTLRVDGTFINDICDQIPLYSDKSVMRKNV